MNSGVIALICGRYVVLNERRKIIDNKLLLLPNDMVEYNVVNNNIIIEKVVNRNRQYILGIVKKVENNVCYLFCPNFPKSFVPTIIGNYNIHTTIIIEITLDQINIVNIYDNIMNPSNDMKIILDLYKMNANSNIKLEYTMNDSYIKEFKDLSHLDTFNIDPTNSKDFDDAISIENNTIYVHIVDANEMIPVNSDIEMEAFNKAFTLYLNEHIENILPTEMAEYSLSLIKGEVRKVITVEYNIDMDYNIPDYKIYRSIIIIKKRYDYNSMMIELEKDKYKELINFCKKWQVKSIDIPHLELNINKSGMLDNYNLYYNNDMAHKVVETLMVLTNLTISNHIKDNIPQRYHSKVKEIINEPVTNNNIIDSILSIKKYKLATYDNNMKGHFGLNLSTYTHFTSPIRRYFDVIIHRLLSGYKLDNIDMVLEYINSRERYIDMITKLYNNLKILRILPTKVWEAYVINKTDVGVVCMITEILYELFLFTPKQYKIGDMVTIKINSIVWETLDVKAMIL